MLIPHARRMAFARAFLVACSSPLQSQVSPPGISQQAQGIQAKVITMLALGRDGDELTAYARDAYSTLDIESLSLADLTFPLSYVGVPKADNAEVNVRWSGLITAPVSREYQFSITPIDLIYSHSLPDGEYLEERSYRVTVNDIQVLDLQKDSWDNPGIAIALTAGQAVSIEVELDAYEISRGKLFVANLNWEGAGMERQPVPASAYTLPDLSGPGLLGEYTSPEPGKSHFGHCHKSRALPAVLR